MPQAIPVNTCLQVQYVLCAELKGAQSRVSARTGIGMPRTNRRAIIPTNSIAGNSMRSVIDSSTLTLTLDLQAGAMGEATMATPQLWLQLQRSMRSVIDSST